MSGPAQTPASKRFLASQNTSSTASTRRSHFLRTPQNATSSPYTATPSFSKAARLQEEIETNFEANDNNDLPTKVTQFQPSRITKIDSIEDDFEIPGADDASITGNTHRRQPDSNLGHAFGDGLLDDTEPFSSPLPKRQKHTHDAQDRSRAGVVSSSPVARSVSSDEKSDLEVDTTGFVDDENRMDFIKEPMSASSRFLNPAPGKATFTENQAKPSFKAFLQHMTVGDDPKSDIALPDAFSPSRRRGKREYVHGGTADTIRNSVLQIANEQTQKGLDEGMIRNMKHCFTDESGRFDIAKDEEGKMWMLVRQNEHSSTPRLTETIDASKCVKVMMKGSATTWTVKLADDTEMGVAILWDIVR